MKKVIITLLFLLFGTYANADCNIKSGSINILADDFDERNDAVKKMIAMAIEACHRQGKYIGICGQGPSDHADFAEWLLQQKITSISLNPDTVVETWNRLGAV